MWWWWWFLRRNDAAGQPITGAGTAVSVCRWLTLAVVLLFVMLMVIIRIVWSVRNPHAPTFSLISLSISNHSSSSHLSREYYYYYDIEVGIKNPNKKVQILLDNLMLFVLYDDDNEVVAKIELGGEYSVLVDKMGEKNINLVVKGLKMVKNKKKKMMMKMKVKVLGRVRYSGGKYLPSTFENFEVDCEHLNLQFYSSANSIKDCRLSLP